MMVVKKRPTRRTLFERTLVHRQTEATAVWQTETTVVWGQRKMGTTAVRGWRKMGTPVPLKGHPACRKSPWCVP